MKLGTRVGLGSRHTVLDGDPAPSPQRGRAPNFWPISVVAKWLDGSRCHLVWREASTQATLCYMGTQLLSPKTGRSPLIFGTCLSWPNGWMDQDATWCGGRPRLGQHCVRCGPSSTPKGQSPHFSADVCCGQTAGWIKMSLGTKVGLGPGHIVLHEDPAAPKKGTVPQFAAHVYCGQPVAHLSYC